MDRDVHRIGLTLLHSGEGAYGSPAKANIVFIHGLWGHPRKTWEAQIAAAKEVAKSEPFPDESGRRGSIFSPKTWKRTPTGVTDPKRPELARAATTSLLNTQSVETASTFSKISTTGARLGETRLVESKKVFWPKDLLPHDIPDASIYTYGYDADVVGMSSSESTSKMTFTKLGQNMLMDLDRDLPDHIPIILCAHSLGGIIVKEVLWQSKTNIVKGLHKIQRLTKCVMFFGTPHRGSKMAGWGDIGARLVKIARDDVKQTLVKSLNLNSEILDRIQSGFEKMLQTGGFYVHTFQEGRAIFEKLGKVVEDYSSKLGGHPNLKWEVIDGSHRKMVQFKSANDPGYRQVGGALKGYMNSLTEEHDAERESIASNFSAEHLPSQTIFSMSYKRNKEFIGRRDSIEAIQKLFSGPSPVPFVVLYGLGGIGKTQVALELAHRWKDLLKSVIWVHAGSRDRLEKGFRDVLDALGIQYSPEIDYFRIIEDWLRDEKNGPWLMIVDNVDDANVIFTPLDSESSSSSQLLSCIPKVDHGSVLFTTRWKAVAQKITKKDHVQLGEMTEQDAKDLLKSYLGDEYEESPDVNILLEELGYIPLAITHAAALMSEKLISISDYLEAYQASEEDQIELLRPTLEAMGINDSNDSYSNEDYSVLKTWLISFSHVKADMQTGPLASELLSIMSFMDRQEIPKYLFDKFRPGALPAHYTTAFGTLKSFSMINQTGKRDQTRFSMHRLVQLSMRKWLEQNNLSDQYAEQALILLSEKYPEGKFENWKICDELVVHADSVLRLTTNSTSISARIHLLKNVASFQGIRGQYISAETKWKEVVKFNTESLGSDHIETLRAMDSLALVMRNQAIYEGADKLSRQVLDKKETILAKKDVETLNTAHLVATLLGDRGKHYDAEKLHRENYEARRELLGEEHPDTLKSASNLSLELWELGIFAEAEGIAQNTLEIRKKVLGETHPDTLDIAGTLGFVLECSGKLVEAEELKHKMLEVRTKIYGPNHPDTADSEHDVGWILHQLGRYEEAEPHYRNALESKRKLLGDDHPKTLTTMCNLPVFYCDNGDYQRAEEHSHAVIHAFKRKQGGEHPQTLDAIGGLAVILRHRGKLEEAAKAARTSIEGRERVIGKNHPWTWPPVSHWGYILTLQGELTHGEEVIRRGLAALEQNLGKDHPYVFISLLFLSENLVLQGGHEKLQEAENLARQALEAREKILGTQHPYTFKTSWKVARVLKARGRLEDAVRLCTDANKGMRGTLGLEHPDTVRCDEDLRDMRKLAEVVDEDAMMVNLSPLSIP